MTQTDIQNCSWTMGQLKLRGLTEIYQPDKQEGIKIQKGRGRNSLESQYFVKGQSERQIGNFDFWHLKMIVLINNTEQKFVFIYSLNQVK